MRQFCGGEASRIEVLPTVRTSAPRRLIDATLAGFAVVAATTMTGMPIARPA